MGGFGLERGADKLRVKFVQDQIVYGVRISGRVTCEFNAARELCSVLVWLSDTENARFEEYVEARLANLTTKAARSGMVKENESQA